MTPRGVRRDLALLAVAFAVPLLVLSAERAVLHLAWGQPSESGPLGFAFLHGLRFDAAGIAYPFALALLAATFAAWREAPWLERTVLTAVTAWIGLVAAAELPFFAEFRGRLDGTALEYLDDPATVFGTAAGGHLVAVALGGLAAALAVLLAWRVIGHVQARTEPSSRVLLIARGAAVVALALPIRGGIDRPLRPADAAAKTHHLTQLTLSGSWTLLRSAYEGWKDGGRGIDYDVDDDDALSMVRASFRGAAFTSDDRPMLRTIGAPDGEHRNVVLVVLESFAARHVGALGAAVSWTPALDALIAERGTLYTRCLANGPSTNRALPALLAGLPSTPRRMALTKSLDGQRELLTIGRVLGGSGWRTTFLTGGAASWENLGGWCRAQGFETIVDRDDFSSSDAVSIWGVSDADLLERTLDVCRVHAARDESFCVVALTGSNHPPFAVPESFQTDTDDPRERAFRYADAHAAGFVRTLLEHDWAAETDVYLVGDHGITESPRAPIDPERHHVLLWTSADGGSGPRRFDHVVSHVDLPTTLLERCGYHGPFAGWGPGLDRERGHPAVLGPLGSARVLAEVDRADWTVDDLDGTVRRFRWRPYADSFEEQPGPQNRATYGRALLHLADRAIREGRAGR